MKSPLRYQVTQFDCGPTTLTNAIMFLFEREEIPPDLMVHISQCTLDSYDRTGHCGMFGTSGAAIRYLGTWLNELRFAGLLPIRSRYIEKEDVFFGENSELTEALRHDAVIVLHVFQETGHYILVTGETEEGIQVFDPYFHGVQVKYPGVIRITSKPFTHNFIISPELMNSTARSFFSMGEPETREAIILCRDESENDYSI